MSQSRSKTGIKVVVVGAGFGGLTAAIECHRHGHDVVVYESFPELKPLGDIISFGANAGRIFRRWGQHPGEVAGRLAKLSIQLQDYGFRIHKYDTGEVMYHQQVPARDEEAPIFNGHRGELHEVVFNYAQDELGIPIHLGQKVQEYFEDDGQAGIVLASGERIVADVVVGADGVRSKARELVLGYEDKPKSSGKAFMILTFPHLEYVSRPKVSLYDYSWVSHPRETVYTSHEENSQCLKLVHE